MVSQGHNVVLKIITYSLSIKQLLIKALKKALHLSIGCFLPFVDKKSLKDDLVTIPVTFPDLLS